jgi:hypothetical protein
MSKYKTSSDSWQMKIQEKLKIPFPFAWLTIAFAFFLLGYALVWLYPQPNNVIHLFALKAVLIAAIANAVVFFEKRIDELADLLPELLHEDAQKSEQWLKKWYSIIFWSRKNIVTGFILGVIVTVVSIEAARSIFSNIQMQIYSLVLDFAIGFLGGSMLWTMLAIAGLMRSLGRDVNIKLSIFDSTTSALRAASSILWKIAIIAALIYVTGVLMNIICSVKTDNNMLVVEAVFGLLIILYFIIPQFNIHRKLLSLKRGKLKTLVNQIDKMFDSVTDAPTADNINQLKELFHLQAVLNGKSSWSFGSSELLILLGTVFVPLLVSMMDWLFKRLHL